MAPSPVSVWLSAVLVPTPDRLSEQVQSSCTLVLFQPLPLADGV